MEVLYDFSVGFKTLDTSNIIDTHKYLKTKMQYKIIFGLIKRVFIELITYLEHLIIQNAYCSAIKNVRFNLLLVIYILVNTVMNYTFIHLQLN